MEKQGPNSLPSITTRQGPRHVFIRFGQRFILLPPWCQGGFFFFAQSTVRAPCLLGRSPLHGKRGCTSFLFFSFFMSCHVFFPAFPTGAGANGAVFGSVVLWGETWRNAACWTGPVFGQVRLSASVCEFIKTGLHENPWANTTGSWTGTPTAKRQS